MPDGFEIKLPSEEEQSLEHFEAKNAREFVNDVKCRFIQVNQRDKYDNFLNVLKDYKTQRFDHLWPLFFYYIVKWIFILKNEMDSINFCCL